MKVKKESFITQKGIICALVVAILAYMISWIHAEIYKETKAWPTLIDSSLNTVAELKSAIYVDLQPTEAESKFFFVSRIDMLNGASL